MAEKPGYRDNLELLNSLYPGKATLTMAEVKKLTGWRDSRTVKRHLTFVGGIVSKAAMARLLS